jgi:hypothetical protein
MEYTIEFDAPAEKIYQDFTSREYWQTLMDEYRFLTPQSEITSFSSGERGTDVAFVQNLPRMYLPPIARTVLPVDMIITRKQHFDRYDHDKNRAEGTYSASIPHALAASAASTSSPRPTQAAGCGWPASARSTSRSSAARWRA